MSQKPNSKTYQTIDASELEDFNSAIRSAGYGSADFELSETEKPLTPGGVCKVEGALIVKFVKTGIERSYATGFETSWVANFESELQLGLFNKN